MPQKTWIIGEQVLAADFNTYVQTQVVARFATVAARDAAWPAATAGAGAMSVTTDTGMMWVATARMGSLRRRSAVDRGDVRGRIRVVQLRRLLPGLPVPQNGRHGLLPRGRQDSAPPEPRSSCYPSVPPAGQFSNSSAPRAPRSGSSPSTRADPSSSPADRTRASTSPPSPSR